YRRMDDDEVENAYGHFAGTTPTVEQLQARGISPMYLALAKGRDGMRLGEWPLEYHFDRSTFRELDRSQPAPPRFSMPATVRPPLQSADAARPRMDLLAALDSYN